jgi:hypothetical protein
LPAGICGAELKLNSSRVFVFGRRTSFNVAGSDCAPVPRSPLTASFEEIPMRLLLVDGSLGQRAKLRAHGGNAKLLQYCWITGVLTLCGYCGCAQNPF